MNHKVVSALIVMMVTLVLGTSITGVVSADEVSWNLAPSPVYVWDDTVTVSGTINAQVPENTYLCAIGERSGTQQLRGISTAKLSAGASLWL